MPNLLLAALASALKQPLIARHCRADGNLSLGLKAEVDSRLRGNDGVDYKVQRIFFSKKEFLHTLHPV